MAVCPFHDDHNPSLSVNDQTGLFNCFGCGTAGSIFDFYAIKHNLDTRSHFSQILDEIAETFGITNGNRQERSSVIARYDYHDEFGCLQYQIERKEPKSFGIRRPDNNGGWIYNKKDTLIVPYHLPDIINATEVMIVEGEKDADRLTSLGFIATTSPFGAGKWPADFGKYFRDKHVVLFPDNDQAGFEHMRMVAENLKDHAASIKWIDLPDLPPKGDFSDFVANFSSNEEAIERLAIMIDGAPLYKLEGNVTFHDVAALDPCLKEILVPEKDILEFPDIMAGAARKFVDVFSAHLEPSPVFFFMAYLTCLGNLVADKVKLASEAFSPARLFTLLLGGSADDRKSTAISKTIRFFINATTDFGVCHGVGSAEGLAKILNDKLKLILVYDEFKAFVSKSKIESSVLLSCVTTLFESDKYENTTLKKAIQIEGAALSMLAACTVETYETIFDQSFIDIGFPNRLFLCPGKSVRRFAFPEKISDTDLHFLGRDLGDVLRHLNNNSEIGITDEARKIYQDWYLSVPGSVHSKRIDSYSLRLMQLLAVNEQKSVVDAEILDKVIKISNWQLAVRKRFDPVDADSQMARMEEKIRRVLANGGQSRRDLRRAVHADRVGIWYFETALTNLSKSEEVFCDPKTKKYVAI